MHSHGLKWFISILTINFLNFILLCGFCNGSECNKNPYIKNAGPLVETNTGTVIGKYVKVFDTDIASFQGIPFAEPPLGDKRFAKPNPIEQWYGTLFAQDKPPACMQYSSRRNFPWLPSLANRSEDCLYLNIWTPVKCFCDEFKKLPVMVWIHGGGYYSGSSNMDTYDGSVLASYGEVIVVSLNYRVGLFGFFNGGTKDVPGNVGLYDQLLALRWINDNIENFGGDSKSITLFGESAGSISTSLHIISPLSKGLFHRVILQSGTAYHPRMTEHFSTSIFKANAFAEMVGCSTASDNISSNHSEVINCLKKKNPLELAEAEDILTAKFPYYFAPSFEANCDGCNEFLPESPITILEAKNFSQVQMLIGSNKDEATIFIAYVMPEIFSVDKNANLSLLEAKNVIKGLFTSAPEVSPEAVFDFYFRNITEDDSNGILNAISDAFGDYLFTCPGLFQAEISEEAYLYWITHRSLKNTNHEWMGVTHFDEVPYVFGKPIINSDLYTPEDRKLSGDLIKKWTDFATNGHPLSEDSKEMWPKLSAPSPIAYELNLRSEGCVPFPRAEACEFWRPYFTYESSLKS